MRVRTSRLPVFLLCAAPLVSLLLTGCCKMCTGDKCTARSPWQSPTIQAMRTLLLVNREELRILRIDGRGADPTCIGTGGVREYHLLPGEHTVTAVFRYAAPRSEGLLADVQGQPLTHRYALLAGHEYVAFYREHPGPKPEHERGVADIATNVLNPPQLHWSLEIVDLATAGADSEPEVRDAQTYSSWVNDAPETLGK